MTRLKTPGGRSASTTHSASAIAAIAVVDAGVQTTVLPHASAGAISSAGIVYGQFHGVMTPITPRGRRKSSTLLPGRDAVRQPPFEPLAVLGRVAPVLHELLDLVARLGDRLALVERQRLRERLAPLLDDVGDAVHAPPRARTASLRAQRVGGAVRGPDRELRVVAVALRHLADRLAGRGRVGA